MFIQNPVLLGVLYLLDLATPYEGFMGIFLIMYAKETKKTRSWPLKYLTTVFHPEGTTGAKILRQLDKELVVVQI